jgi:hypothetical protein
VSYYSPESNFWINQILGCATKWLVGANPQYADGALAVGTDGWAPNVPAGGGLTIAPWTNTNIPPPYTRWVFTCTAPMTVQDPSLTFSGVTIANKVLVNPQRYEFDITATSPVSYRANLWAMNPTGAALPTSGPVQLFRLSDEADLNAGKLTTTEFRALMGFSAVHRAMDWCSPNASNYTTPSAVPYTVMEMSTLDGFVTAYPPEAIAKIAKECGCRVLWINIPWQFPLNTLLAWALRWRAACDAAGFTGQLVIECGNEHWNLGTFPMFNGMKAFGIAEGLVRRSYDGTIIPGPDDGAASCAAYAHHSVKCFEAFEAAFGRSRIIRTAGIQTAYFEATSSALHWVDPVSGLRFGEIIDFLCVAPYYNIGNISPAHLAELGITELSPYTGCSTGLMLEQNFHLRDDAFFTSLYTKAIQSTAQEWQQTLRTKLDSYGFTSLKLGMYEGGLHEFAVVAEQPTVLASPSTAHDVALAVTNTATNRLDIGPSMSPYRNFALFFANGDRIAWCYKSDGQSSLPISSVPAYGAATTWQQTVYVKVVNANNSLELYTDAALTNRVTITSSGTYENGVFNATRLAALNNRIYDFLNGPSGASVTTAYWNACRTYGSKWVAQFNSVGESGRTANRFNGSFGLKANYFSTDADARNSRWWQWQAVAANP